MVFDVSHYAVYYNLFWLFFLALQISYGNQRTWTEKMENCVNKNINSICRNIRAILKKSIKLTVKTHQLKSHNQDTSCV